MSKHSHFFSMNAHTHYPARTFNPNIAYNWFNSRTASIQFLLVPLIAKLYSCLANVLISGLETCMVALPLNEKCDRPTMLSLTPEKCGFAVVCQERSSPTTPLILCAEKNGKAEWQKTFFWASTKLQFTCFFYYFK